MEIYNFYEELESSSQCSSIGTFESIDLNNNNNFNRIYRIKHNRNRSRIHHCNKFNGALAFDIVWETGEKTKEPIQNLINHHEEKVNIVILEILNDYITTAHEYPHRKRLCIMCKKRVYNGVFMCKKHSEKYYFLN